MNTKFYKTGQRALVCIIVKAINTVEEHTLTLRINSEVYQIIC